MKMWIGCLAAYNAGRLFGEWHDVSTDADENAATIANVLTRSPVRGAEEWALMDYEAPRALADMLGENPGYETLAHAATIVEALEARFPDPDDIDAVLSVMLDGRRASDLGDIADDVDDWLADHFAGEGDTLADFAANLADDCGMFEGLPDNSPLRTYFDFESYGRDLQLGGDISTERAGGRLLVFWSR